MLAGVAALVARHGLGAATCEAAVVADVRAIPASAETRIVVEVGGGFRYRIHTSEDGRSVVADIEDATIAETVARMLPVADARVDGVIVTTDEAARIVRVSVDVAGRVAPRLHATADASRLVLSFADAGSALPQHPQAKPVSSPRAQSAPETGRRAATASSRIAHEGRAQVRTPAASPASAASERRRSAPVRSVVQKPVVILDPGHGGKDPGAQAWTGEYEKDIVLDVAERVARRLRKAGDVDVVMTRSGDEYIELAERRDMSRKWNADVFVSIHANASKSAAARGFETYYRTRSTRPATSGDREVRRLARLENEGRSSREKRTAGVSRASLSSEVLVPDRSEESAQLARLVQSELVRQLDLRYEAVRDLGAREGPFFVIGNNAAPSVLVEAAFLTHREEGLRMRSEVYREQIADGVARGIRLFLDEQRRSGAL